MEREKREERERDTIYVVVKKGEFSIIGKVKREGGVFFEVTSGPDAAEWLASLVEAQEFINTRSGTRGRGP